jgi:NAD(P)-dependent dehydrogenase (short-subunit alcohol dehydrogenase family)
MAKVWLVTGSGSGLGRDVVEAALAAGNRVVATARRPEQLQDLVRHYGDKVRAIRQDVTNSEEAEAAVSTAKEAFGRLDVVVNNAGYSQFGPFEQISAEDFKAIVDTCFYGVVYTTRAALPVMRKQRSGVIFQVSSVGGRVARPGNSPYHAAKWAVSGFAEALSQETATFGVQVCAIEPGGIRTNWGKRANSGVPKLLAEYEESVGKTLSSLDGYWGHENSDSRLMAELIVMLADKNDLPPHLLLGSDALNVSKQTEDARTALAEKWRETSKSVDFRPVTSESGNRNPGK